METISRESDRILAHFLGARGAEQIAANTIIRNHIVAARLVRDRGRDRGSLFQLQLGRAATRNFVSRRRLGRSFQRILFGPDVPTIRYEDIETFDHPLRAENVRPALLASGSIPLLMSGVRDVPGVPGTLFDGGIIDYHFDFGFRRREGLVLFAHFFDQITPGWFDKPLSWRRPADRDLADVVMLAPSNEFVATLPGAKVPDRNDFLEIETEERIRQWESVMDRCRILADELGELIDTGRLADAVIPFGS
jgi:hypothetical protein